MGQLAKAFLGLTPKQRDVELEKLLKELTLIVQQSSSSTVNVVVGKPLVLFDGSEWQN